MGDMVPGAPSPTEILQAAIRLKKVYEAFFHKHRRADRQLRELAALVATFAVNLENQALVLERAGRFYPLEHGFRETIAECDDFLHDYEAVFVNRANAVRRAYRTVEWAFEDEQKRLLDRLNAHNQAMNSFSLTVILGIALRGQETGAAPAATEACAQGVGAGETRSPGFTLLGPSQPVSLEAPNPGETSPSLDRTIAFRDPFQPTINPINSESPLLSSDPPSAARRTSSVLSIPPSPVFSQHSLAPTAASSYGSPDPTDLAGGRRKSSVGTIATKDLILTPGAVLKLASRDIKLSSYAIGKTMKGHVVIWNPGTPEQVDHRLPGGKAGYPFTKHSSLLPTGKSQSTVPTRQHEVCFLTAHTLRYAGTGKTYNQTPRYFFPSDETSRMFQGALRRRLLVACYEVDRIATATSARIGEAVDQHLKLWRSLLEDRYYLSYFANNDSRTEYREFPLLWFDKPADGHVSFRDRSIRLTFTVRQQQNPGRRFSFRRSSRRESITMTTAAPMEEAPAAGSRARRESALSTGSASSQSESAGAADMPSEEAAQLKYLNITFSSPEDWEACLRTIRRAHDGSLYATVAASVGS